MKTYKFKNKTALQKAIWKKNKHRSTKIKYNKINNNNKTFLNNPHPQYKHLKIKVKIFPLYKVKFKTILQ